MNLLDVLKEQKDAGLKGNLYHNTQIQMAYNTNKIEGSTLTEEHTRFIFELNTISSTVNEEINVDDIVETTNHFYLFDYILDTATEPLTSEAIKKYHYILKRGTADERKDWFNVGDWKKLTNTVGNIETAAPQEIGKSIDCLLEKYHKIENITLEDIVDFHYEFEAIHPFQDGNGRVGRIIMLKECLKNDIVPFIIEDTHKAFYYRGLSKYPTEKGFLFGTCQSAQDRYKLEIQKLLPNFAIFIVSKGQDQEEVDHEVNRKSDMEIR